MSRTTLWRDLSALRECFKEEHSEKYAEFVKAQVGVFQLMEQHLLEGTIDAQTATAWKGIRQEISALLGLNSPAKSITAHITDGTGLTFEFLKHAHGIGEDDMKKVFAFMDALPRQRPVIDASYFPDRSTGTRVSNWRRDHEQPTRLL